MKVIKTIINLIISFLLIFVLILGILFNFLSVKIFNKENMIKRLEETEFYMQVSREVYSGFEDYIYQSGLPEDTINDLYTDEDIKNDINSIINYIYEGTEIKLSDEKIIANLDTKINNYLESENITLRKAEQDNVNKFKDLISASYKNNIKISNTLIEVAREYYQKANDIFVKVENIPFIAGIILVVLLVVINIKSLVNVISAISVSLISAGVLLKLFNNIVLQRVHIDDLLILSTSLTNFVQNILREILDIISTFGLYYIVGGITGIIISAMIFAALPKKTKEKNS